MIYKPESNIISQNINDIDLTNTKNKEDGKESNKEENKENINDKDKPEIKEIVILKSVEKYLDNIVVNEDNKQQGKNSDKKTNQTTVEDNKSNPQKKNAEENNKTTGNEPMVDISKNQNRNLVKVGEMKGEMKGAMGSNKGIEEDEIKDMIKNSEYKGNNNSEIVKDSFETNNDWKGLDLDKTEDLEDNHYNKRDIQIDNTLPLTEEDMANLILDINTICTTKSSEMIKN